MKSDWQLQAEVVRTLYASPRINLASVQVSVTRGVVALNGFVADISQKKEVIDLARAVDGTVGLIANLGIEQRPLLRRSDAEIAQAAREALRWNKLVPEERIRISVVASWITLMGTVDWDHQRRHALGSVARLHGACGVINLIEISSVCNPHL